MMTPGQTSAQGTVLLVEHPSSTIMRMAAHVFDLPQGGIAYLDLGWSDPLFSGHADHILTGALNDAAGYPGWLLIGKNDVYIEPDTEGLAPDGDRETARRVLERVLEMSLPDISLAK